MTSTGNDNDVATLEYRNGARFSLVMTATAGSGGMEKEAMDIFTPGGAMSMRDFVELRIRGIKGQHDCLFEPHRCQFAKDVLQWGYDFWQLLINRLVLEDATESQPIVPVALAAEEQPFGRRVEEITKVMAGRDWRERNLCGDKGWTAAFRHFAQAYAENAVPETATGYDGCLANEIGYALLESAKRGIPVDFDFRR